MNIGQSLFAQFVGVDVAKDKLDIAMAGRKGAQNWDDSIAARSPNSSESHP